MLSSRPNTPQPPVLHKAELGHAFEHLELAARTGLSSLSGPDREKLLALVNATRQELSARSELIVSQGEMIGDLTLAVTAAKFDAEATRREHGE